MAAPAVIGSHRLQEVLSRALEQEAGLLVDSWPTIHAEEQEPFVHAVMRHRVVSVIAPIAGELGLDPGLVNVLTAAHAEDILDSMRLQSAALSITRGLAAKGVRSLVYKGVALAAQTTDDPASRGYGDLDILVAPADMPKAHSALQDMGALLVPGCIPDPGSPLWPTAQRIGCEAPYRYRGMDIDVHWRIDRAPQIARMPFDDLWERRAVVEITGQHVPTLGAIDSLLVTCVHGTKEQWRQWRWVLDVVRQLRGMPGDLWNEVRVVSRRTGCEEGFAIGLAVAGKLTQIPGPFSAGPRAQRLADEAWDRAMSDASPFGDVSRKKQFDRLGWTLRTLPTATSAGSIAIRLAWSNMDMADFPMPRSLVWAYPLLRPYLWNQRLRSGRYGGHPVTQ